MIFMEIDHKMKKLLKYLKGIKGRHTELVTVYIPSGYNISDVVSQLKNEQGTADNIKSKSVRKNVTSALEKIIRHLQLYRKTPDNGLALFCGNVSEKDGVDDIQLFPIEPPEPVRVKLYWCDQVFRMEPIEDIFKEKELYGIICLDKSEADVALLKGKKLESIVHMESIVPGKTRAGGQSAMRFSRIREGLKNDWLKRVGDAASKTFDAEDMKKNVIGILISGPGPIKDEFLKGDYVLQSVREKIIGTVDTGYTGDVGLDETVERGRDILKEASVTKEKDMVNDFFTHLQKAGAVVYGVHETMKALRMGAVSTLLLNENIPFEEVAYTCGCDNEEKTEIIRKGESIMCENCNQQARITSRKELVDLLEEEAKSFGVKIEYISEDTREGQQFKELGGIGGFLRYQI